MSQIQNWFVTAWDNAIRVEASQKQSRLFGTVTDRGTIEGESFTINNLADSGRTLTANTVRHGDTEFTLEDQSARIALMSDFYEAVPLDRNDIPKMKVNPVTGGAYMGVLMARKNRTIDNIIYNAARATIPTKDGGSIALPSTQKIAVGGTSFTKAKLIATKKIFRRNEADKEAGEELFILYNDEMLEDILTDTTLTSADFMSVKMLQDGDVARKWMGFNWVPFNGISKVGTDYFTVAYAKSGIHFGKGYEEGKISPRPDKKDLTQASMGASYGAGRQDEKKVVEIAFL
jgi:hypothetical protein